VLNDVILMRGRFDFLPANALSLFSFLVLTRQPQRFVELKACFKDSRIGLKNFSTTIRYPVPVNSGLTPAPQLASPFGATLPMNASPDSGV